MTDTGSDDAALARFREAWRDNTAGQPHCEADLDLLYELSQFRLWDLEAQRPARTDDVVRARVVIARERGLLTRAQAETYLHGSADAGHALIEAVWDQLGRFYSDTASSAEMADPALARLRRAARDRTRFPFPPPPTAEEAAAARARIERHRLLSEQLRREQQERRERRGGSR